MCATAKLKAPHDRNPEEPLVGLRQARGQHEPLPGLAAAEKILKTGDVKRAAEAAADEVQIESDLHGSAAYKKQLIRVYLARAIHEARNAVH